MIIFLNEPHVNELTLLNKVINIMGQIKHYSNACWQIWIGMNYHILCINTPPGSSEAKFTTQVELSHHIDVGQTSLYQNFHNCKEEKRSSYYTETIIRQDPMSISVTWWQISMLWFCEVRPPLKHQFWLHVHSDQKQECNEPAHELQRHRLGLRDWWMASLILDFVNPAAV